MKMCVDCGKEKDDHDFYSYELPKNKGRCKECLRPLSAKINVITGTMLGKQRRKKSGK